MSGKQKAVLWLGLILITFNLIRKWKEISAVIFTGAGTTTPSTTQPNPGGGSITIPIDPVLPTGPKITIPIPKLPSIHL